MLAVGCQGSAHDLRGAHVTERPMIAVHHARTIQVPSGDLAHGASPIVPKAIRLAEGCDAVVVGDALGRAGRESDSHICPGGRPVRAAARQDQGGDRKFRRCLRCRINPYRRASPLSESGHEHPIQHRCMSNLFRSGPGSGHAVVQVRLAALGQDREMASSPPRGRQRLRLRRVCPRTTQLSHDTPHHVAE